MRWLISAICGGGTFKALQDIDLHGHQRVKLQIMPEDETSLVES